MKREPVFNIPSVVIAVLAVLAFIHAVRTLLLSEQQDIEFLLNFAFIPARYDTAFVLDGALPGGGADVWTFVTYALIHADWVHLGSMPCGFCRSGARSRAVLVPFAFWRFSP